jgi:hypothetical protein
MVNCETKRNIFKIQQFWHLPACLSVCVFVCVSVCVCMSVCLPVCLSVCVYVCLKLSDHDLSAISEC